MGIKLVGGPSDGEVIADRKDGGPGDRLFSQEWVEEGGRPVRRIFAYHRTGAVMPEGHRIDALRSTPN
jgi:hypothetical protein